MTKILHINELLGRGGREIFLVQLCNQFALDGEDVSLLLLSNNFPLREKLNPDVHFYFFDYACDEIEGIRLLWHSFTLVQKMKKTLLMLKPDIVHIHSFFLMYLLIAIAIRLSRLDIKVVRTIHTGGLFYASTKLLDKFRLWVEKVATTLNPTYIAAISSQVLNQSKKYFKRQTKGICLIYNGIDLERFDDVGYENVRSQYGCTSDDVIGVYVARFDNGKNQKWLVDLWGELKRSNVKSKLWLVGSSSGITFKDVYNEIVRLGLESDVICLGESDNIPLILKNVDFALFPSSFEGFSIALIEKMAAGLPVIVSDIPPFREIICDNEMGIIVPLNDRQKWLSSIESLIVNKSLRKEMGAKAKCRSLDFSMKKAALDYERLYSNILRD